MSDETITSRIVAVLRAAAWPVPTDELTRILDDVSFGNLSGCLASLKHSGRVNGRLSPDDRSYAEWWLLSQENKHRLHLSIKNKENK